jgi:hypothetical protein
VILVSILDLDHIRQINTESVFGKIDSDEKTIFINDPLPAHTPPHRLLIAFWDIETYTETDEKQSRNQVTQDVDVNKIGNFAYYSIPFIISVSFCLSDQ